MEQEKMSNNDYLKALRDLYQRKNKNMEIANDVQELIKKSNSIINNKTPNTRGDWRNVFDDNEIVDAEFEVIEDKGAN